jgi:voltage-gated hydrogen channel 1
MKDRIGRGRVAAKRLLSSRKKHYFILGLVAVDVAVLLANIFIELVACNTKREGEPWVSQLRSGLTIAGLVFSSVFLLELLLCLVAFGFRFVHLSL